MTTRMGLVLLAVLVGGWRPAGAAPPCPASTDDDWVWLDNGQVRLGAIRSSGAGIGWLSLSDSTRNLLNHFDRGRLVQQSYYGRPDGSLWAGKPWRWNPVQGGDYKGVGAEVLELKSAPTSLYARTRPRNWAGCLPLPEVSMEQWITLEGPLVHVRCRLTYRGETAHPKVHQEVPAVFLAPELETLVVYDGDQPWTEATPSRTRPGWPNAYRPMTEGWAAYVDGSNIGVGAFVPVANRLTYYRYGAGPADRSSCSYFAPIVEFAITPGFVFEYDLYLTVGSAETIRARFREVRARRLGLAP